MRAEEWYRHRAGSTSIFPKYRRFVQRALKNVDYFIFHDEKGVQCNPRWPREVTRLEEWAQKEFMGPVRDPVPDPEPEPDPPAPDPKPKPDGSRLFELILRLLRLILWSRRGN